MSASEIAEIVHKVIVKHHLQADVAKEHRIKPVLVCSLSMKAKKKTGYLKEILAKRDAGEQLRAAVAGALSEMNQLDVVVDTVSGV